MNLLATRVIMASWFSAFCVVPATAQPLVDVFPLPGGNSTPVDVAAGNDGSLWFTDPGTEVVGRISPLGQLSLVPLPSPSGPTAITIQGDSVWFTLNDRNSLARVPLQPPHVLEEIPLPSSAAQPFAITAGLDGDLWFTEIGANQIARRSADGAITEIAVPTELALPAGIAVAADGGVWFTQFNRNQIARLDPDGSIEGLALPNPGSAPFGIIATGNDIWFTELNGNRIGHVDADGVLREIDVPTPASQPAGITVGPDGGIWFTQINADRIGRVVDDSIIEIDIGAGSFASGTLFSGGIAGGPGTRISFAASAAAAIRSVDTCGENADCASGNCDDSLVVGLCGPVHTPTPVQTPTATAAVTATPTSSMVPTASSTPASPKPTSTLPTVPMPTSTPLHTPSVTPTVASASKGGSSGGGCAINSEAGRLPDVSWVFLTMAPFLLLRRASCSPFPRGAVDLLAKRPSIRRQIPRYGAFAPTREAAARGERIRCLIVKAFVRSSRVGRVFSAAVSRDRPLLSTVSRDGSTLGRLLSLAACLGLLSWPHPASAQEPTPTPPPTHTRTPTATASSTRAATATPHLLEIRIGNTVAGPGDAAHIAVAIESTNTQVAAVASEIVYPSDIVGLDAKNCFLRPGIDKSLRADPVSDDEGTATMRIVVQSSRNFDPLPDGVLYTCTFLVSPLALPGTYAIDSGLAVGFGADGTEIGNVRSRPGELTVSLIGEPCTGDCDGSGDVTVDEVIAGVSIALGTQAMGVCPQLDADASSDVTVDELVLALTNALDGCVLPPPPQPTPTPTTAPARTPLFVRMGGNDANSGLTPARALRTISQAARIVPSGYRIVVGPGLYAEGVTTDGQGGAPQNVIFEADVDGSETGDPPGAVIIDAAGSVVAAGFRLTSSAHTVIDGFTITGAVDGGIVIKSDSDDFVIRNCTLFGNPGAGIRVQDSARVLVFNNLVYGNAREGIAIVGQGSGSPDARIFNNTVYGNGDRALRVGTSQNGSPGSLVINNIFQNNGIGSVPPFENVKVFPSSEPGYDADFNLVFPPTYLPFDIAGEHDLHVDAILVAVEDDDFRLAFDSVAIDAGGTLPDDLEAYLAARTTTAANLDDGPLDLGFHAAP